VVLGGVGISADQWRHRPARVIPSGSMENTLLIGDHLIMSRIGYDAGIPFTNLHVPLWRNPKRQQIVIFRPVIRGEQSDVIKRVIGLPGETVDIRDGSVWDQWCAADGEIHHWPFRAGQSFPVSRGIRGPDQRISIPPSRKIVFSSWETTAETRSTAGTLDASRAPTFWGRR